MRIIQYHFKINQGATEEELYQEIKENDLLILTYLNILNDNQVTEKIEEYINNNC